MGFNINNFRGEFIGKGARPNLFEVQIPFPTLQGTTGNDPAKKMTFMCKGAQIPGADIGMIDVPYFGRTIKFAGNRTFAEWTTTVINDEDFEVHQGIVNWFNGINDPIGNITGFAGNQYQVDGFVTQFTKEGTKAKKINLVNMWPQSIAPIDLSWDTNDALEEFTVTWQYDYWTVNKQGTDSVVSELAR